MSGKMKRGIKNYFFKFQFIELLKTTHNPNCHSEPVRKLAWESTVPQWVFEIATPVCATLRNDNEGKQ